jgi:hypothetical protein
MKLSDFHVSLPSQEVNTGITTVLRIKKETDVGKSFVSSEQNRVKFISNKSPDYKLEFDPVTIT